MGVGKRGNPRAGIPQGLPGSHRLEPRQGVQPNPGQATVVDTAIVTVVVDPTPPPTVVRTVIQTQTLALPPPVATPEPPPQIPSPTSRISNTIPATGTATPPPKSGNNGAKSGPPVPLIGGIAGGVFLLLLILSVGLLLCRRRRRHKNNDRPPISTLPERPVPTQPPFEQQFAPPVHSMAGGYRQPINPNRRDSYMHQLPPRLGPAPPPHGQAPEYSEVYQVPGQAHAQSQYDKPDIMGKRETDPPTANIPELDSTQAPGQAQKQYPPPAGCHELPPNEAGYAGGYAVPGVQYHELPPQHQGGYSEPNQAQK